MIVKIYGKDDCPYCSKAKMACEMSGVPFQYLRLGRDFSSSDLKVKAPKMKTYPAVFIDNAYIGGFNELVETIT